MYGRKGKSPDDLHSESQPVNVKNLPNWNQKFQGQLKEMREIAKQKLLKEQAKYKEQYDRKVRAKIKLRKGMLAWIYRPWIRKGIAKLKHEWSGPVKLIQDMGYDNWQVRCLWNSEVLMVHSSQVASYFENDSWLQVMITDLAKYRESDRAVITELSENKTNESEGVVKVGHLQEKNLLEEQLSEDTSTIREATITFTGRRRLQLNKSGRYEPRIEISTQSGNRWITPEEAEEREQSTKFSTTGSVNGTRNSPMDTSEAAASSSGTTSSATKGNHAHRAPHAITGVHGRSDARSRSDSDSSRTGRASNSIAPSNEGSQGSRKVDTSNGVEVLEKRISGPSVHSATNETGSRGIKGNGKRTTSRKEKSDKANMDPSEDAWKEAIIEEAVV